MTPMTREAAREVLSAHQLWRRGGDGPQTDPLILGQALDLAIAALGGGEAVDIPEAVLDDASGKFDINLRGVTLTTSREAAAMWNLLRQLVLDGNFHPLPAPPKGESHE
jgi:hypothetical protein